MLCHNRPHSTVEMRETKRSRTLAMEKARERETTYNWYVSCVRIVDRGMRRARCPIAYYTCRTLFANCARSQSLRALARRSIPCGIIDDVLHYIKRLVCDTVVLNERQRSQVPSRACTLTHPSTIGHICMPVCRWYAQTASQNIDDVGGGIRTTAKVNADWVHLTYCTRAHLSCAVFTSQAESGSRTPPRNSSISFRFYILYARHRCEFSLASQKRTRMDAMRSTSGTFVIRDERLRVFRLAPKGAMNLLTGNLDEFPTRNNFEIRVTSRLTQFRHFSRFHTHLSMMRGPHTCTPIPYIGIHCLHFILQLIWEIHSRTESDVSASPTDFRLFAAIRCENETHANESESIRWSGR